MLGRKQPGSLGCGATGRISPQTLRGRSDQKFGMQTLDQFLLAWLGLSTVLTFLLFGYDKFAAGRSGWRVPEFQLVLLAALGGWVGGGLAMLVFRHKTAKLSFHLKYAASFLVWAGLIYARLNHR